jgi:GTP diphosphokinase / guanosine-3',5'-bis(diphosphate) 3'-diphosphatase
MASQRTTDNDLAAILKHLHGLTRAEKELIRRAYQTAQKAHAGITRQSGEPYFTHCVAVAMILAEMNLDAETIAAGLLHDVIEDNEEYSRALLEREFGGPVALLVDGVTKLARVSTDKVTDGSATRRSSVVNREMEYYRKMLMTMNDDIRVLLVKLADRLHNMRTLGHLPVEKQQRIARETMDIFAPLANRLGIWQIKSQLEDLSFRYLNNEAYREIVQEVQERSDTRTRYVNEVGARLQQALQAEGIRDATITSRPKHYYSIWVKMQRKNVSLEEIYDIRAVRVIVNDTSECYRVLGIVHQLWAPVSGEFDDYIANPKNNSYQSLHTAVRMQDGRTLEVQIRTRRMHEEAEYGIAAHWHYKEAGTKDRDDAFDRRVADFRKLVLEASSDEIDNDQSFVDMMKSDILPDRIYVFTPKGDLIDLPAGATPIDFAYHIHTEIGNRCRGAKVRGRLVPLDYTLKSGDEVTILTDNRGRPSMDWLNVDLGYVRTSRARSKIRHYFKKQNRDNHIAHGREALERELRRLGLQEKLSFEQVAQLLSYSGSIDDFLAAIGSDDVSLSQVSNRLAEQDRQAERLLTAEQEAVRFKPRPRVMDHQTSGGIQILGTGGLLTTTARCCNPVPGDDIIGFTTRGRGVNVHRRDCPNVRSLPEERLVDVSWGGASDTQCYTTPIQIVAFDRGALLRDIANVIAEEGINIAELSVKKVVDVATINMEIELPNNRMLSRLLARIEGIPNVYEARRRNVS